MTDDTRDDPAESEALIQPEDLAAAFGLLTRIPVAASARGARAAWAWPLVGAVVGLIGAAVGRFALLVDIPVTIAAILALAAMMIVTGAMHEDGLADTADGLFGGHSREDRLEIMKDSRIGTFGMLALLLVTLARWSALIVVLSLGSALILIAVGALTRLPMVLIMAFQAPARRNGLSRLTGRPEGATVGLAVGIALALGLLYGGFLSVPMLIAVLAVAVLVALFAERRIGGQTGDVLGASQQLAELACLTIIAANLVA